MILKLPDGQEWSTCRSNFNRKYHTVMYGSRWHLLTISNESIETLVRNTKESRPSTKLKNNVQKTIWPLLKKS